MILAWDVVCLCVVKVIVVRLKDQGKGNWGMKAGI
jgi:hypothetical protein